MRSPHSGSGRPTTATSRTAGCSRSTSSISKAETLYPPVLMISTLLRPEDSIGPILDDGDVAGAKPAVAEGRRCCLGTTPVLPEDRRTAHFDLARRAGCNFLPLFVHQAKLHAGKRGAHEPGPALAVSGLESAMPISVMP